MIVDSPVKKRLPLLLSWSTVLPIFLTFLLALPLPLTAADQPAEYLLQIKPILHEHCYACHGALKQEGGLRLDTVALAIEGGDSGAVIRLGNDIEKSILLERITAANPDERMPPQAGGEPLKAEQVALIRQWISSGAKGPADEQPQPDPSKHWAFQHIVRPAVPIVRSEQQADSVWERNSIDAFLHRQHRAHRLTPQPEASRLTLLRRLYFDLIGVPPTAEEIAACESDTSPQWYEKTVKRLLDDPRHGERWARHWMDIWRYSDWWGLGDQLRNSQKHMWHWRDWIVESLNADTPYDEMVRLMLAADELQPNDLGKLRATGYLARNFFLFNRPQWMEETVEHVSKGFLGLTMNCAKCHDHKFDPLAQIDFYRLRAFFEPYHVRLDIVPGESDVTRDGVPRAYDRSLDEATYLYVRGDEKNPDKSNVIEPGVPSMMNFTELKIEPVTLPDEAWQPERRPWVLDAYIAAARKRVDDAESELNKAQKKLTAATKAEQASAPDPSVSLRAPRVDSCGKSPTLAVALDTVVAAKSELNVNETALAVASAELESVERRAEAQRAEWNSPDSTPERTSAAIRAERLMLVAKARHSVAVAEQATVHAAADKKEAAEKTLMEAREALEKSITAVAAEINPTDPYTKFIGALWTPTRFLNSGNDDPRVEFSSKSTGRRTALANWITDRRNPLTARVAVNHIWTRHMGQPLVPTVFDFGQKGTPPTHPELLDWLASELFDSGWSMKHLHSLIVNSAAYRMSSTIAGNEVAEAIDPDNHNWWRRVPIRLESQVVRDSLLSMAGTLDPTMSGPSIHPNQQATSTRRSLYFFHSNNERSLFLTTFDDALVKDCYRREQSIVPQQALALINSRLVLDASDQIAKRLAAFAVDDSAFIRNAFRVVVGIDAGEAELLASVHALQAWSEQPGGTAENARANLVWALINHNDFVTLR